MEYQGKLGQDWVLIDNENKRKYTNSLKFIDSSDFQIILKRKIFKKSNNGNLIYYSYEIEKQEKPSKLWISYCQPEHWIKFYKGGYSTYPFEKEPNSPKLVENAWSLMYPVNLNLLYLFSYDCLKSLDSIPDSIFKITNKRGGVGIKISHTLLTNADGNNEEISFHQLPINLYNFNLEMKNCPSVVDYVFLSFLTLLNEKIHQLTTNHINQYNKQNPPFPLNGPFVMVVLIKYFKLINRESPYKKSIIDKFENLKELLTTFYFEEDDLNGTISIVRRHLKS